MREKGWDIAIAEARNGRPAVSGSVVPGVTPAAAENLRMIWSQVFPVAKPSRGYCLLVTAAEQGEGVSQITTGLALAGVQAAPDRRIAIVDFNLRRPTVAKLFRVPVLPGVADVLEGKLPLDEAPVQTQEMSLDIVPAGCLNGHTPSAFPQAAAAALLDRLREDYDHILVDAPAVNHSDMTTELASLADGVLLVIKTGSTRREAVVEARLRLDRAGAHIVGAVLNA
jgi:Mrp family chromosome partitioning ATPase